MTRLALPYQHARYTVLGLVRAGGGLTVLAAIVALGLLVAVFAQPDVVANTGHGSAVLGVALLAATASTLVHTVLVAGDARWHAWDQYLTTLPGYRWTRGVTFLLATCVVGMLAALPVTFMGLVQSSRPDAASWAAMVLLVPVAALPGLLLGLLLARIRSVRRRQISTGTVLLVLTGGALLAVGSWMPDWAELVSGLTPTFAASRTLMPVLDHQPLSAPHLAMWVFWCLTPLLVLSTLDRHRIRSLP